MRLTKWIPDLRLGVAGLLALAFAGPALAILCHPDPPGTRSLTIHGRVDGYSLHGTRVAVEYRARGCERRVVWQPLISTASQARCTSRAPGGRAKRVAFGGRLRVVLQKGSVVPDRPDRLAVYDARTGAGLHNWPLPVRAHTLEVARGVALLSTSSGVYAVRLSDGQYAMVGVERRGDHPQIAPAGMVYQDNRDGRHGGARALMKFVPFDAVARRLHPAGPLRVPYTVGDFSTSGGSVIFVIRNPAGGCDRIGEWSVAWHYSTVLMNEPAFCPRRHGPGGITALALGGQYLEAVTRFGDVQTLVSSTIVRCTERVVARTRIGSGTIIRRVAGGSSLLAYALGPETVTSGGAGKIGLLHGQRPAGVLGSASVPMQLASDRNQLAVLRADGRVDVWGGKRLLRSFEPDGARAIALRATQLTVLTRRQTLDVFSLTDGELLHSWSVPAGTSAAVSTHFGVAVLTAGRNVVALQMATGRKVVLFHAPAAVAAQVNDAGIIYRYNLRGAGFLGFLPFAAIDRALG
jgi:hypothetical protein